jgi:exosortase J
MSAILEQPPLRRDPPARATQVLDRRSAWIAVALVTVGLAGFYRQFLDLWYIWTGDALRSFGILIPPISLWLALRSWTWRDWQQGGSWWGLPLAAAALFAAALASVSSGVLLFLYFGGAVLLFGGAQAWRKAAFALLLWLFVNPLPHGFEYWVDQPLQTLGARTARAFARLIAVPVSGDALKLMFAPHLGIFIAPGCDGLRGASTMGFLAAIIGHLRRMPRLLWATYVGVAVALAYLLNLLRLCAVIGYYWIALCIPVLGAYGTQIDYLIGGTQFFCAAWFVLGMPRLARRGSAA